MPRDYNRTYPVLPDPEELARMQIGNALDQLWEAFRATENPGLTEHLIVAIGSVKDALFEAKRISVYRKNDTECV
jgi:hypothetical protein